MPSGLFVPGIILGSGYGRLIGKFAKLFNTNFFPGTLNLSIIYLSKNRFAFLGACGMLAG